VNYCGRVNTLRVLTSEEMERARTILTERAPFDAALSAKDSHPDRDAECGFALDGLFITLRVEFDVIEPTQFDELAHVWRDVYDRTRAALLMARTA
jgi:hypothetical protein